MSIVGRGGNHEISECVSAIRAGNSARSPGVYFYLPRIPEAGAGRCGDAGVFCATWIPWLFCGARGDSGVYWRRTVADRAVHAAGGVAAGGGDGDRNVEGEDRAWGFGGGGDSFGTGV